LRTLVISDLHLGNRAGRDVLQRPAPLDALLEGLEDVDRLVLLGDLAELMTRHPRRPMAAAQPVLRSLGRRLGPEREVILVPGNHDAPLISSWARARGRDLGVDAAVPVNASPALTQVASWLSPARVRIHYPGVWLGDRIWATHGHYLDRHLFPESAFGVLRGDSGSENGRVWLPSDYEHARRRSHRDGGAFLSRLVDRPFPTMVEGSAHVARAKVFPAVPRLLMNARLTPLTASTLDLQMQRASIPAMQRVVSHLGIDADWVLFAHVHRAGPLAGEPVGRWQRGNGPARYVNAGSWLYEPLLVDRAEPPHPYWPGAAVRLQPGHDPEVLGLLDGLTAAELRGRAPR
jgi:UDP-2,3-diacylglucosamine pyrophosphatase LpxH